MSEQNLSPKVTPTLLDRMYNNFVKITDWVMKGKESKYPMPKALKYLFDTTESNANEVFELKSLVTTLQQNLVQKEQRLGEAQSRITALDGALQNVNNSLKQIVDAVNTQQPPTTFAPETPVVSEPVAPQPAPTPAPVVDELVDLDEVVSGNADLVASTEQPSGGTSAVPKTGEQSQNASLTPPVQVSPSEQAIQVSAEAVGAGNIDPASYQALDAEIGALLG